MFENLEEIESHPFADLFPMCDGKQLDELAADVLENGLLEKIILFDGKILDGRNRYAALKLAKLPLTFDWYFTVFEGNETEALRLVGALNLKRRHLTTGQRAMVASTIATLQHGGARQSANRQETNVTGAEAAIAMKVSSFMVRAARRIRRFATPAIISMCERGEVTVAAAELVAGLPETQQARLTTPAAVSAAAAKLRSSRRTFGSFTERRVVATIGDLGDELSARGVGTFALEAEPGSLKRIDATIELLAQLRAAIAGCRPASA